MKSPKTRCDGQWTEARFNSFIKGLLRSGSQRWKPKYLALKAARTARNTYTCAECGKSVTSKNIKADHIQPVVPLSGFTTWDDIIQRMFVEKDGYQAVCKKCHAQKTKEENAKRKANKELANNIATDDNLDYPAGESICRKRPKTTNLF